METPKVPEMTPERTNAIRHLLLRTAGARSEITEKQRRQRIALIAVCGVAAASLMVLVAMTTLGTGSPAESTLVYCVHSSEANVDVTDSSSSTILSVPEGTDDAIDRAIGICDKMWAAGILSNSQLTSEPAPRSTIVCRFPNGNLAVVPGVDSDSCDRLGLTVR